MASYTFRAFTALADAARYLLLLEISSNFVLEHIKIALRKMAPVVQTLRERSCAWYWDEQYVAGATIQSGKSRSTT